MLNTESSQTSISMAKGTRRRQRSPSQRLGARHVIDAKARWLVAPRIGTQTLATSFSLYVSIRLSALV